MAERSTRSVNIRLRPSEHRIILVIGDLIASGLAVVGAYYTWLGYSWYKLIATGISIVRAIRFFPSVQVPFWFYLMPIIWVMLLIELYDPHSAASRRRTLRGIAVAAFVGLVFYSLIFLTYRDPEALPRIIVGAFLLYASILTLSWRMLYIRFYTSSGLMRRILVVGAGKAGHTLARLYQKMNPPPFQFVGFIDDDPDKVNKMFEDFPVLGNSAQLLQVIEDQHITDIVVGIMGVMRGITFQSILDAQEHGVEVVPMPTLYEEMVGRVPIHHLESDWLIRSFVDQARVSGFYELFKRLLDILGGLVGLLVFAIIFPFASLATLIDTGFPIFYSQERLGKGGALFVIRKFRTMYQNAEADGKARPAAENDPRVTRVGNFLRKTRLDELPQFWNVLRGDMSLVGPRAERPELVAEYQRQIPFYRARLLVKPGLTGWAQVNYPYGASVEDARAKLSYDLYYVKHRSLLLDLLILVATVRVVLFQRGAR